MTCPVHPRVLRAALFALVIAACGAADDDPEQIAIDRVKQIVARELDGLVAGAEGLRTAAPAPDADGWNAQADASAVADMRAHWGDARDAYEHVEGAIAVLFPDLDAATDERYDGFIAEAPDDDLFDDQGVIGIHAVERVLWADTQPGWVVEFESALPGYQPAAFPTDATQATAFREQLLTRLVDDTHRMRDDFEPLALDAAAAYGGVMGSMAEQAEKISLGATGEDESRYAQRTLADMRANLAGAREIFDAFAPWLQDAGADDVIDDVHAQLDVVAAAYDAIEGDALPEVPASWSATAPSEADLQTPYGQLWQLLQQQNQADTGVVARMLDGADRLGIPVSP